MIRGLLTCLTVYACCKVKKETTAMLTEAGAILENAKGLEVTRDAKSNVFLGSTRNLQSAGC